MEILRREVLERPDAILFVDYGVFRVPRIGRLYTFGGISHHGSTLLRIATHCSVPVMFEATVLPFLDVNGAHTIIHDGCSRFQHSALRELVERNGITRLTVSSTIGPQPLSSVWRLAREHLYRVQPATVEVMRDELTAFWAELPQYSIDVYIDNFVTSIVDY